ncbi:MAG: cellulase family glycosylhydrolase, partial [Lentisphaerae bacterium]|nr:cellulase family glycosylhydrolase [Lentisphaerota bacterium]
MLFSLYAASTLPLHASPPAPRFGVNLAGGDGGKMPGSGDYPYGRYGYDYIYPNADEFAYYKSKGFNLVRLPVKWERLQNTLGGPLAEQDMVRIDAVIAAAHAQGIEVMIDLHNYNSYRILTPTGFQSHSVSSDGAVTYEHLQDFWTRIALRYVDTPGVFGYDLMNEPGGTLANWQAAAQAAVYAIRTVDTNRWIIVEGVSWAGAQSWMANNATLHVEDPCDRLMYSAHSYWDRGYQNNVDNWKHDGLYTTYAQENGSPTMGIECLAPFVNWIKSNGYIGFVGEYGVPGTGDADSDLWNVVLDNALAYLQTNGISGTYWTGGPWYGSYQLTCEPSPITGPDRPQMSVLAKYAASEANPPFNPLSETIIKEDNIHPLNQGSSWVGGITPDSNDIALWNNVVGANSVLLGADQSWGGITVDASHVGSISINGGTTLALGEAGITFVPNISLNINCGIALTSDQIWSLRTGFFNVSSIDTHGHTLTVSGGSNKKFKRAVVGGGQIIVRSGTLTFDTNTESGAPFSKILVTPGASLVYDKHTGSKTLAADITLECGKLQMKGDKAAPTIDTIDGDITIADTDPAGGNSIGVVTLSPDSARNVRLVAERLNQERNAIVLFRGTNLGTYTAISQMPNSGNILFTNPLSGGIGGGGDAGSTTISIIPGVLGGISGSDGGSTFVNYTPEHGVRPLAATEFAGDIASGTISQNNVRLAGTGVLTTVTDATTVNSLIVAPSAALTTSLEGDGLLTVTSGMVILNPGNVSMTTSVNTPLNFGNRQGVICSSYNRGVNLNGAIHGSDGLIFCQVASGSPNNQLSLRQNTGSTYSGDTVILGRIEVGDDFLPHGLRCGDIYLHGYLRLNQSGYNGTVNGLFEGGILTYSNSRASSLAIGDNHSESDFYGSISGNDKLHITKIGSGTLTLSGSCDRLAGLTLEGGTTTIDGAFNNSPVTVKNDARLCGVGTFSNNGSAIVVKSGGTLAPGNPEGAGTMTVLQGDVNFEAGSALEVSIGEVDRSALKVAGTIRGTAVIPAAISSNSPGKWKILQASFIEPEFESISPRVI